MDPIEPRSVYGTDEAELEALERARPELAERLHPALPYRASEVVWAARFEMARTVEDVLSRRLRALLLDARASVEMAPRVARLMAEELGRDEGVGREPGGGVPGAGEGVRAVVGAGSTRVLNPLSLCRDSTRLDGALPVRPGQFPVRAPRTVTRALDGFRGAVVCESGILSVGGL